MEVPVCGRQPKLRKTISTGRSAKKQFEDQSDHNIDCNGRSFCPVLLSELDWIPDFVGSPLCHRGHRLFERIKARNPFFI